MPTIYMIRHGEAAAGWNADADPGLSELGRSQAEAVADEIEARAGGRLPILTSPLKRCRETSMPLAARWNHDPAVEPRVAEIPSPIDDLESRGEWLRKIMAGTWAEAVAGEGHGGHLSKNVDLLAWRQGVANALLELPGDTVIFSHFIAINVAAGIAMEDDRLVTFKPDNCSVTVFETGGGTLRLIEKGREAVTKVN
ncbi:histidine phosphatase family protein [Parvibaculum sp. MBR-TMA-1.3b-4.2]|jgi:broad specificity phosphatase PhoE